MISRNYNLEYKGRRKLLHDLDDYKGEGVMIMYSNSHAAFVIQNLREIIEQAITYSWRNALLELQNQTHSLEII